ncbi:MAG: hypothetical protein DRI77_14770 [Chloroflexi bacterium]|nr:MAG: hypothetical protein DRI77_14770 [Chloroflexota bacterium]
MSKRFVVAYVVLLVGLSCLGPACVTQRGALGDPATEAAEAVQMDLPVTKVVMFQNGVAYMERRGRFAGNKLVLRVRPGQIQDILKSITVVDFAGGRANSLALPVDVGNQRALAELPKLALGQGSLAGILGALRGAQVQLRHEEGVLAGRLVGLDSLPGAEGGAQLSVLDDGGTIRILPLGKLRALRILDKTLASGLVKGLDISLGQDAWRSVELTIYLDQEQKNRERDLMVAYLVEMPTWKSSYRLVLDGDDKPLLQGWAIVDNVSGADWQAVKLTLTTGSPVSFLYDLYAPRFVKRPDLTPYGNLGIAPPVARSVMSAPPEKKPAAMPKMSKRYTKSKKKSFGGRSRSAPGRSSGGDWAEQKEKEEEKSITGSQLFDSMRVQASTQKVGSMYRFELEQPMNVPNRSSTMIALINKRIPGRAIYSYNPDAGLAAARHHPFRAVSIRNASGAVLEPGPISIMRDGHFVGEGLISRIEKGQDSYVAYALDTAVNVTANSSSSRETVGLVKISRGVLQTRAFRVQKWSYEVKATKDDGEALPLMVNLPKRAGWEMKLVGGKLESETAERRYFSLMVKPGETNKLVIEERYPVFNRLRIMDHDGQQAVMVYVSSKEAKPELVSALAPLVERVRKLSDVNEQINLLDRQRSDLQQRAHEVRANLKLLKKSRNAKLKAEQQRRLMGVDRKLSRLTDKLVTLRDQGAQLKVELNIMVDKLELVF